MSRRLGNLERDWPTGSPVTHAQSFFSSVDPEDDEEMHEGETIQAFWSADKKFYEAEIIKISGECFQN